MNKLIKNIIPFIAIAAMACSCDRNVIDLPEPSPTSNGEPVLRLELVVDNSVIDVAAGVDNIFNHTDFELDQDEVYIFEGLFSDADCDRDCPNSYQFKFRNYETGATAVNTDQSLSNKSYDFKYEQAPIEDSFELHMDIINEVEDPEFTWSFGAQPDEADFTQQELSDILLVNVPDAEVDVTFARLEIKDNATGLKTSTEKQIYLDSEIQGVTSFIKITQVVGDSVDIDIVHTPDTEFEPFGGGITTWAYEDLDGQNSVLPFNTLTKFSLRIGNGKSISNVTNFVSNTLGTRTKSRLDIAYDASTNELIYHEADFNYFVEERIAQGSALALQTFEFELYDEAGVLFSSAKGDQADGAFFEILNTEEFIENENGQETIQVTCRFSCQVFSDSGESKTISDANAVIAVAIP